MNQFFRQAIMPVCIAALVGCVIFIGQPRLLAFGHSLGVSSTTMPWPISQLTQTAATAARRSMVSQAAPASSASQTIQAVIQKANQEQQTAFAKNDPTVMQDTATTAYYNQLVQINQDMTSAGVSAIKLIGLQWGAISVQNPTTAQATTVETWQTTYSDGSVTQNQDRNVYTLVQNQGTWKIQTDDHPDAALVDPSGVTLPNPSIPPAPVAPNGVAPSAQSGQSNISRNWSGYAATGGSYTGVTGTWTVPSSQTSSTSGTGGLASGATWVGIGGVQSRDLIQAGTEETTAGARGVRYDAWIETLPQASHSIPLAVSPGDSVTVSIDQQSQGQWLIAFKDNTTGQSYQTTESYQSSLSSAEWVVEAPSAGRGVLPLDNFGTVQFSAGSAIDNGKTETIAQSGAQAITMMGSTGSPLATPSALTSNGQGFSVSRSAASPSIQLVPGRGGFRQVPGTLPGYPVDGASQSGWTSHGLTQP